MRTGHLPNAAFWKSRHSRARDGGATIDLAFYRRAVERCASGEEFCLAVLIAKSGSAPQVPGAKALFLRDGSIEGTIGGGCLEMECRRLALESLATGKTLRREFKLDDDFGWDDGLICGGRVQVLLVPECARYVDAFRAALNAEDGAVVYDLVSGDAAFATNGIAEIALRQRQAVVDEVTFAEPVVEPERLFVFGAGHIGTAVAKAAADLGFAVTVVDDRAEFANERRMPWAQKIVVEDPSVFAGDLVTRRDDYLCLITRGHRNDSRVLRELIGKPHAYLGMIGSKRKREVVKQQMIDEGYCTAEEFEAVRSPMGVDIGAESVAEIAISIAAELIQVRASRRGPSLARCSQMALVEG